MNRKQILSAVALFSAVATVNAADVQNILGRGAPTGNVNVERIVITGKTVSNVLGRAGFVAGNTATAKFAVSNTGRQAAGKVWVDRLGRV